LLSRHLRFATKQDYTFFQCSLAFAITRDENQNRFFIGDLSGFIIARTLYHKENKKATASR
jgi:hypothetical protein